MDSSGVVAVSCDQKGERGFFGLFSQHQTKCARPLSAAGLAVCVLHFALSLKELQAFIYFP